ncbi:MAG: transposase [Nitrososphaeraceae archaeon]
MKKDQLQQKRMEEHHGLKYNPRLKRAQKINGILNVFGVYDHTNDQMYIHSYRNKTVKQFLDFIKRINKKYASEIKQIFLVLDNISIHRSKKVRETIEKRYPRINLVFLPTRSPELNLIEVRWMYVDAKTGYKQFYI